jgi:hypothetical protein
MTSSGSGQLFWRTQNSTYLPSTHLRTETSSVSGTLYSLEYLTIDKVQNHQQSWVLSIIVRPLQSLNQSTSVYISLHQSTESLELSPMWPAISISLGKQQTGVGTSPYSKWQPASCSLWWQPTFSFRSCRKILFLSSVNCYTVGWRNVEQVGFVFRAKPSQQNTQWAYLDTVSETNFSVICLHCLYNRCYLQAGYAQVTQPTNVTN